MELHMKIDNYNKHFLKCSTRKMVQDVKFTDEDVIFVGILNVCSKQFKE